MLRRDEQSGRPEPVGMRQEKVDGSIAAPRRKIDRPGMLGHPKKTGTRRADKRKQRQRGPMSRALPKQDSSSPGGRNSGPPRLVHLSRMTANGYGTRSAIRVSKKTERLRSILLS
jgi:hypothetical protein